MKPLHFLFLSLLLSSLITNAQSFKVIQETDDYILKDIDSAYYWSQGTRPHDDFVIDSSKTYKANNVIKLPLDNGKFAEFHEELSNGVCCEKYFNYYGENKKIGYYKVSSTEGLAIINYFVNKKNGTIDTLIENPEFSPTNQYYVSLYAGWSHTHKSLVLFKNINTNNQSHLFLEHIYPYYYNNVKWINNNTFIFRADTDDEKQHKMIAKKYFLLQIKENMNIPHDSFSLSHPPFNPYKTETDIFTETDISTETDDYILKEIDSLYYYTHGLPPKNDFIIDSNKIHKVNDVYKLPLDNGKEIVLKDELSHRWGDDGKYVGLKDLIDEYHSECLKMFAIFQHDGCLPIYLINQQTNEIDTVSCEIPVFSPSNLNYVYCACCCLTLPGTQNIFFKKAFSGNKIGLEYHHAAPEYFKWVDDFTFEFIGTKYTGYPDGKPYKIKARKYYLIQIKH